MPVDQQQFASLLRACVFDARYHDGTIQDRSQSQIPMAFSGAPSFVRMNGLPALKQAAVLDGTTSAARARIVDVTGAFSVEWCGLPMAGFAGSTTLLSQVGPASGGFSFSWDAVNAVYVLALYDNAGAVARSITTPAASAVSQQKADVIITSSAGGTVGTAAIRGVPVVATLGGAGAAANINADGEVIAGGAASGLITSLLARVSPVVWGREDQTCLATAASLLVGGW